jgi:carbon starvation protein
VNVEHRPGGAVSLAVGMSSILSAIPGMKTLMPYWFNFALMFEALFILTTVDAGTRVARFLLQEFGGRVYKPLGEFRWLPGNIAMSAVVVFSWGYLIYTGSVATIWPMFGVANQLLAAIALGIGTTIIIKSGRVKYAWVSFLPMCFMYITTLTAAWKLVFMFRAKAQAVPAQAFTYNLDAVLVGFMALLAVITLADMLLKWSGWLSGGGEMRTSEVVEYATEPAGPAA